ncbi:MAG: DNA-binding protein WhiA [Solirubrobacterales bacterium]
MSQSFSHEMRSELARIMPERKCCIAAQLAAILRLNGSVELAGRDQMNCTVTTENAGTARMVFKFFKELFDIPVIVTMESKKRFKTSKIYTVRARFDREHLHVLQELGVMNREHGMVYGVAPELVRSRCCKRAYLRGVFLARGSINKPEGAYHLEITLPGQDLARAVQKLAAGSGIKFRLTERKAAYVLYIKDAEQIVDFLRVTGASKALLEFENVRIVKSMKNQVNRLVNCETANLEKTLDASMRQVEAIRILVARSGVEGIPDNLRELALLRMDFPDMSLKELGELMTPPLTKSGVAYRMKKLEQILDSSL